jgi:hypothetical protein
LAEVYGADVSRQTISTITDKVLEGMTEWQNRPPDCRPRSRSRAARRVAPVTVWVFRSWRVGSSRYRRPTLPGWINAPSASSSVLGASWPRTRSAGPPDHSRQRPRHMAQGRPILAVQ